LSPRFLAPSLALLLALPAVAHEVSAEVARDRAVAVRARDHHGKGLAGAEAEVFSPADPATPFWKGRTDRDGWVAFVPDAPGRWRVRVIDATGHGIVTDVDVPAPGTSTPQASSSPGPSATATLARPALGVAIVAAIFGFLYLRGRNRTR
jgi:nickel transport protein